MKLYTLESLQNKLAHYCDYSEVSSEQQRAVIDLITKAKEELGGQINSVYFRAHSNKGVTIIFETIHLGYNFEMERSLAKLYFMVMDLGIPIEHKITQRPFGNNW